MDSSKHPNIELRTDLEKSAYVSTAADGCSNSSPSPDLQTSRGRNASMAYAANTTRPKGILATLRHFEATLDRKLGIEGAGPERILPEDRKPPRTWMMATVWASSTLNLSCFATGFLGWEFGLNLTQSLCVCIFGTFLGSMLTVCFA